MDIKDILHQLKQNNYRLTKIRVGVLNTVVKSKKPLTYFDIQKLLKTYKISADKATVYRELTFLKKQGIIRELQFKSKSKYYELMPKNHHHHIICNTCQTIDHVELTEGLGREERKIKKHNKFKILSHYLEFYGLCQKCQ